MSSIEAFIQNSLDNAYFNEIFELNISDEVCDKIQKQSGLNVKKYRFIIEAQYVRHIRNRHEEDLFLLSKIETILNTFDKVEKSLTRNSQTGKTDISLVFEKKINEDITKMIAIRIIKYKFLSLKTLYRK